MKAPSTPSAAASDGVASPPYIEPRTQTIRNNAGARFLVAANRSRRGMWRMARSASGTKSGRNLVRIMMKVPKADASMSPGKKPAVNRPDRPTYAGY